MPVHRDRGAVGQSQIFAIAEFLDEVEDVIPSATVQAGGVVLQLEKNFIHLKGGGQSLDKHGSPDGAARNTERILREVEDAVPQACFQMALHLGKVKIRAGSSCFKLGGVV